MKTTLGTEVWGSGLQPRSCSWSTPHAALGPRQHRGGWGLRGLALLAGGMAVLVSPCSGAAAEGRRSVSECAAPLDSVLWSESRVYYLLFKGPQAEQVPQESCIKGIFWERSQALPLTNYCAKPPSTEFNFIPLNSAGFKHGILPFRATVSCWRAGRQAGEGSGRPEEARAPAAGGKERESAAAHARPRRRGSRSRRQRGGRGRGAILCCGGGGLPRRGRRAWALSTASWKPAATGVMMSQRPVSVAIAKSKTCHECAALRYVIILKSRHEMCGRAGRQPSHKTCSPTSFPAGSPYGHPAPRFSLPSPWLRPSCLACSHLGVLLIVRESKRCLAAFRMFVWQLQHPHRQDSLWEVWGRSPGSSGSAAEGCERRSCSPSSVGWRHGVSPRFSQTARTPGLLCGVSLVLFLHPATHSAASRHVLVRATSLGCAAPGMWNQLTTWWGFERHWQPGPKTFRNCVDYHPKSQSYRLPLTVPVYCLEWWW